MKIINKDFYKNTLYITKFILRYFLLKTKVSIQQAKQFSNFNLLRF